MGTRRYLWLFVWAGVGIAMPAFAAPADPSGPELMVPINAADIDFEACKAWADGKAVESDFKAGIMATLGLQAGQPWEAVRGNDGKSRQYLVVLKRPVKFAALLFQRHGTLKYWKPGSALPADPAKTDSWVEVQFPPGQSGWRLATVRGETQAFLCSTESFWGDWSRFSFLRLLKARLHNIVPEGIANSEAEYIQYNRGAPPTRYLASNIIDGSGRWQSHGPDQDNRIPRAPVSDVDPTWFVISWDEPHDVSAILLKSNFKEFKLYAYRGQPGINPAVAGQADWQRVKFTARADADAQWLAFPPVKTRGFRFLVDNTEARFGAIDGLQAFVDLEEAPVPLRRVSGTEPQFKIGLTLPEKLIVSLAVDDAAGKRVRNFPARIEMNAGAQPVGWDLKDENGGFVAPGSYTWKAITHPGLTLKYEMTPYPNVEMVTKANSPWLNGQSGPGGWMADHSAPRAVCAAGDDRVFLSSPCCESGVSLIECDLEGRKYWGYGNVIAWTGPSFLASDGKAVYGAPITWGTTAGDDYIWKFGLPNKELETWLQVSSTATRRRGIRGLAIRDGRLYVSVNAGEDWLENATAPAEVDLENCEPKYPKPRKSNKEDEPDFQADILRLLRLTGTPPGCRGLTWLETAKGPAARQHIVIALQQEAPIGSFVFPLPETKDLQMIISVLKPGAPYPPAPNRKSDWIRIYKGSGKGWTIVAAPEKTVTRAVRLSFDMGLDELDEALMGDVEGDGGDTLGRGDDLGRDDDVGPQKAAWKAQLEGLKILRRRFENLFPTCKVTVNSGTVDAQGEWDAQRDKPLTTDNPGIYMMEWAAPQAIRGLAIKEIDGRFTDIDAWAADGAPDLKSDKGWEKLTTYEQKLRYYYAPDQNHNSAARYMDGYVDFGRDVKTRALRLRVTEQWMWKEEDRAGCYGVRRDRGGETLDPTRCRIYGVAPLRVLGGEPAVDSLTTQRIEVYDLATKKMVKEIPLAKGGDLAFAPDGALWALSDGKVVKVDLAAGKHASLALDVKQPTAIAFDKAGELLVYDSAPSQMVVRVFNTAGQALRTIGTPGGRVAGPYDPKRFTSGPWVDVDLAVDGNDQLWVAECDFSPKRVSLWGVDGSFKKDMLGNTPYGGGGCLDRYDKSRLFYQGFEFALDWKSGTTALKNVLWRGNASAGEQPIQFKDRLYLVTRPLFTDQSVGIVYLYEKDHLKCMAAVGQAGRFPMLRTPGIFEKLGKKAIGYCYFAWSDRNGDGAPQPDEVEFFDAPQVRPEPCGKFDEMLGIDTPSFRYEVKEMLANGAPVYERKKKAFQDHAIRMDNGQFFLLGNEARMAAVRADGKVEWTHPAEGWGTGALNQARPWFPGQVVGQFGAVGHETASAGDLGEFFVTHGNNGIWHIWTADGLLAGQLFRDMRGPGAKPWSMLDHQRGLDVTDVTLGQEHFNGYFCKTREDNRYYAVAGHNHVSVVEVLGIEKFKRLGGTLTVSQQDVEAAMEWDRQMQARKLYEAAKIVECRRLRGFVTLDGNPAEWDFESARLPDRDVSFAVAYDDANLYVCFKGKNVGPMKNSGNDWHRLFKTGAAVDFQIGTDPAALPGRQSPVAGDSRLLMTMTKDGPVAVLYQPNAPGAKPGEAWETHTMVFQSSFDRVAKATEVSLAAQTDATGYCAEALIPLKTLGLTIQPDVCYKMDWGVLVSGPDGNEVMQRLYWANPQTSIVSDEAAESRLHPDLWGMVRFGTGTGRKGQPEIDMENTLKGDAGDELKLDDE